MPWDLQREFLDLSKGGMSLESDDLLLISMSTRKSARKLGAGRFTRSKEV